MFIYILLTSNTTIHHVTHHSLIYVYLHHINITYDCTSRNSSLSSMLIYIILTSYTTIHHVTHHYLIYVYLHHIYIIYDYTSRNLSLSHLCLSTSYLHHIRQPYLTKLITVSYMFIYIILTSYTTIHHVTLHSLIYVYLHHINIIYDYTSRNSSLSHLCLSTSY